ncbi:MAG: energy-coupling factor transporter ATPase [Ruminococcaceae bacterium]|nr:energy-coupling factor transporter ATPase [Oscillospiraceae bacterium]
MIEINDLRFKYESREEFALDGINLKIKEGEFVAVLGHNGSGKSTLAKHLNAILLPSGGKVYAEGIDTADLSRLTQLRRLVGMVFQNPDNQIVASVVEEDVAFGPENLGVPPEEIRRRVDFALKTVGMYEMRNSAPYNLSGGQKQRVAIAGIIAMMPKYIVFDEPTAMLDPSGRQEVMSAIKTLNREHGITTLLITHYMDEAAQADRIIVIDHGKVIVDDTPQMTFANVALLKKLGLDVPQVTDLMYRLRGEGADIKYNKLTVDECYDELVKVLGKPKK